MIISISGKKNSGKDKTARTIEYVVQQMMEHGQLLESYSDWKKKFNPAHALWKNVKWADKLKDMVCLLLGCTREQLEDREFKEKELGEEWWYYKIYNGKEYILFAYLDHKDKYPTAVLEKHTPRSLMLLLGTECGRNILHPNTWVNGTMVNYKRTSTIKYPPDGPTLTLNYAGPEWDGNNEDAFKYPNWTISDTRFPNEIGAVKKVNGLNIRLNRKTELRFPKEWSEFIQTPYYYLDREKSFLDWAKIYNYELYKGMIHDSETSLDNYQGFDYVIDNNGTEDYLIQQVKTILEKEILI